jgi:membrane protein required for colicin V production
MNWLDFILLAILLSSTVSGAMKGMARVAIGLVATILGVLFAARWYTDAGMLFREYVSSPAIANAIGFLVILIAFTVAGAIIAAMLAAIFKWVGLSWLDRSLGAVFGLLRGLLVAVVLLMIALSFPRQTPHAALSGSRFAPYVIEAARVLAAVTPPELREAIRHNYEAVREIWGHTPARLPETQL